MRYFVTSVIVILLQAFFSNITIANNVINESVGYESRGKFALQAQKLLKKHGYYAGEINGKFEESSVNAVLNYQRAQGLPDTGIVDSKTWDRLLMNPQIPISTALPDGIKKYEIVLCASKGQRKLFFIEKGIVKKRADARFGGFSRNHDKQPQFYTTKIGTYKVEEKIRDFFSRSWKTSMPYTLMVYEGVCIHYSNDFHTCGYDGASHGCINLRSLSDARWFYENTPTGTTVIIY